MDSLPLLNVLSKVLPIGELHGQLHAFLAPLLGQLPEKRLRDVALQAVEGILAAHSPLVSRMAAALTREEESPRATAERLYRFLWNERFSYRDLTRALYALAQRIVARYRPPVLLVAVDPVNFEKPYTEALEGVSTVYKATPPGPGGEKRLTPGYPAITATLVNLPEPAISYAAWYSYQTEDFWRERRDLSAFHAAGCWAGRPRTGGSSSSAPPIGSGWSRSTTPACTAGSGSTWGIWWTPCPCR